MPRLRGWFLAGMAALGLAAAPPRVAPGEGTPVRVLILVMAAWERPPGTWRGEAEPWVGRLGLTRRVEVPGLAQPVLCGASGACLAVVGEGPIAAAASVMALGLDPGLDLSKAYVLVAGIAGVPPRGGTLGSVAWADWVVDADAVAEIHPADLPAGWPWMRFRNGCPQPWCDDSWGTGAFRLEPALVKRAMALSGAVPLMDSPKARAHRARYVAEEAARRPPGVSVCSSLAGATYWHGARLSDWARWWVERWTQGEGRYCATDEEDFAIVATLQRLSTGHRVDARRVLVLRAASNFDQPAPGGSVLESLRPDRGDDGLRLALENVGRVGWAFVQDVLAHWPAWEGGVGGPAAGPQLK